ncbi:hypothetical protein FJSC11DRAFT_2717 [Fischerella thermalis JSC-11]|uniref:Uncharacterized protein n=1 Tax=Fischerella thermalis JSC-11 TaxID=741277 RepID=G6FV20_9CYAN|nr:hypothetical protein FJSC11DRAFT_2717 [Fischerella thermalis JSC-11]
MDYEGFSIQNLLFVSSPAPQTLIPCLGVDKMLVV